MYEQSMTSLSVYCEGNTVIYNAGWESIAMYYINNDMVRLMVSLLWCTI